MNDWLADKKIGELGLRKEGVIVLGINRSDGTYIGAPDGATMISHDDVLVIYGQAGTLEQLDQRGKGMVGDHEHREAVMEHKRVKSEEKQKDRNS